jgi:hypothetical protein
MHVATQVGPEVVGAAAARAAADGFPVWCPWPLPSGWTVTGIGWVGDERAHLTASVIACTGPASLIDGPAEFLFVAEEPGVGLGVRYAGLRGPDAGPLPESTAAHAKVKIAGHPAPLWAVDAPEDRSVYVGEAHGRWLWAVAWPAPAGYLLADDLALQDLGEYVPDGLVYGAASPYLTHSS